MPTFTCPDCNKDFKNIQGYTSHRAIVHGDHSATHSRVRNAIIKCFRLRGFDDNCATRIYGMMEDQVGRLQEVPRGELEAQLSALQKTLGKVPKQPMNTAVEVPKQGSEEAVEGSEGDGAVACAVLGGALLLWWLMPKKPQGG